MKQFIKFIAIGFVMVGMSGLTGCSNTLHGAGKDISNIGDAMNPPPKKVVHHQKKTSTTTTPATTATPATTTTTTTDTTTTTPAPAVQTNMSGMPINSSN